MPDSQRTTITPAAARFGLFWLMIILSVWSGTCSADMATATAATAVAAPSATAAATMDGEVALPEELSSSDWQSIRAAYEANRHAVQQSVLRPGSYRARNPGQQWLSAFNEDGVAISPDHGRWQFGLRLARWGHAARSSRQHRWSASTPTASARCIGIATAWKNGLSTTSAVWNTALP